MSKLEFTCYESFHFIQHEAHTRKMSRNTLMSSRAGVERKFTLLHPKIYCLGPEEEVSNYVVNPHRKYAFSF